MIWLFNTAALVAVVIGLFVDPIVTLLMIIAIVLVFRG